MILPIEDYALIGDCKTAALVGRDGSIDWLCWPRFNSAACFDGLLGTAENGRWLIAPEHPILHVSRRYRPGTLVLETEFQTETGRAAVIDFMPPADGADLVRIVIGRSGRVAFRTELVVPLTTERSFHGSTGSMTERSTRLPVQSVWSYAPPLNSTAKTSKQWVISPWMQASPFLSCFPTDCRFKVHRRRSIHSTRWSARQHFGPNGATGVPTLDLGPMP